MYGGGVGAFAGVDLGVSKDTAAGALARLRAAVIVTAEQERAVNGAFAAGSYRIDLPACLQLIDQSTSIAVQPRRRRPSTASPASLSSR